MVDVADAESAAAGAGPWEPGVCGDVTAYDRELLFRHLPLDLHHTVEIRAGDGQAVTWFELDPTGVAASVGMYPLCSRR